MRPQDDVREGLAALVRRSWATRGTTGPRKWRRTGRGSPRSPEHRAPTASCRRQARGRGCARCSIPTTACRASSPRAASSIRSTSSCASMRRRGRDRRSRSSSRMPMALFAAEDMLDARSRAARISLVVSQVLFQTGQVMPELPRIVAAAHARGRARAARCLPFARRVSGRPHRARRRLRGGRQLQVPARRPGACFLYVAPRHLDRANRNARRRLVRQGFAVRLRAPGSAALCRGRRRVARIDSGGAAALPGARRTAYSRRPSALRGCAPIRSKLQRRLVLAACRARSCGARRDARTAVRSSWSAIARRPRWPQTSRRAASSPMPAVDWLRLCPDVLYDRRRAGRLPQPRLARSPAR